MFTNANILWSDTNKYMLYPTNILFSTNLNVNSSISKHSIQTKGQYKGYAI